MKVPGVVVLYELPRPPWTVAGRLPAHSARRLRRAGADIRVGAAHARIDWPDETLREFVLFDGLMHEIGHHVIQHDRGKMTVRAMRTADHERRGIRPDLLRAATTCVQIPMSGRGVNTLNVAAAAAVALYFLLGAADRRSPRTSRPETHRPTVLLSCPGDHVEAGSALRSAAAFGWRSVGVDDRHKVWFGTPRSIRTEGRAAARSHRNPLRVVPMPAVAEVDFSRVVVVGARVDGPPLHRVNLTGGPNTLLVIPDEEAVDPDESWRRFGRPLEFARVSLPVSSFAYRYRLIASIVLAEVSRQLGLGRRSGRSVRRPFSYESALPSGTFADIDLVTPHELEVY